VESRQPRGGRGDLGAGGGEPSEGPLMAPVEENLGRTPSRASGGSGIFRGQRREEEDVEQKQGA
jgi:hypothetical protein